VGRQPSQPPVRTSFWRSSVCESTALTMPVCGEQKDSERQLTAMTKCTRRERRTVAASNMRAFMPAPHSAIMRRT
jgi:hypothetical protein